jgi:hypothetical protein
MRCALSLAKGAGSLISASRLAPDTQFAGCIGSCNDIIKRKRAEAALRDSGARIASILTL